MAEATENLLQVQDLSIDFRLHAQGKIRAVRGVSFRVRPGSTVALVGESGSGKSVISQAIMGVLPGSAELSGQILFNDSQGGGASGAAPQTVDIVTLDNQGAAMRAIRGGRISMIFQEPMTSLSPLHTVGDQISEAVLLHQNVERGEAMELTREMLAKVGFPDPKKAVDTYPFELSGGLRQRAMIAMALVCRPALLIADEPTTALDVTIQAQILQLLHDLQSELHMAVLLITHDLGVVANMAEEVVVIYHGEVMESGTLDAIYRDPRHPYLRALMRAVPRVGMAAGERLTPLREVVALEGGHLSSEPRSDQSAKNGKVLLEVRDISKRFAIRNSGWFGAGNEVSLQALDAVSFDVRRGECLGLVGESGCGKTTLSKIILRVLNPDAGSIRYDDGTGLHSLLTLGDDELVAMRRRIQYIFQDPVSSLNPRMTVFDIISEPLIIHGQRDRDARAEIIKELMQHVGLDPRFLSRYPHSFSGGQRQRIGIARALALNPELIVCDEPVSALDVSVQAQVLNLLKDLQQSLGLTYLFISHNLAVVDYMADRIAVMCAGYLVEIAPRELLFQNPVHPYTKALLAAVPRPDPARKLDLGALMEGKVSNPSAWSAPFGVSDDERPHLLSLGDGHYVRAAPSLLGQG
ncbi:MAG: dipeptide ABC transporter ATP-binding protein [Gammaproteobacteria bacterium]|jgi:peptide/nickel transport system ATP-binding protein|nr:dipeptide ABC transporter ATP-binding protein [Gammaproteobacteria bacterium]